MKKLFGLAQNTVLLISLAIWTPVLLAALILGMEKSFSDMFSSTMRLGLVIVGSILLLMLCIQVFYQIDKLNRRGLTVASVALFFVMAMIMILFLRNFRLIATTDSHTMLDQAYAMARNGEKELLAGSAHANYFGRYANNWFLTILFSWFFQIMLKCGIQDAYMPAYVLNMTAILLGVFFTWAAARRLRGLRFAVKVLFFCALNPLLYVLVFWVYSCSISIPFMMAVIYLGIAMYQAKNAKQEGAMCIAAGLVSAAGYYIRPTSFIPVIAFAICAGLMTLRHRSKWKRTFRCVVLFAAFFLLAFVSVKKLNDRYFYTVAGQQFPLTHWLVMGSHDSGRVNGADESFTASISDPEERKIATRERVIENYRKLGICGSIKLMLEKTNITWADGTALLDKRLCYDTVGSSWYPWIFGKKKDLFSLYNQCFRVVSILLLLAAAVKLLNQKETNPGFFVLFLTLLGGIIFYFFWEAKEPYSVPFLLIMYLLDGEGGDFLTKGFCRRDCGKIVKRLTVPWILVISFLVTVLYYGMTMTDITNNEYSLKCDINDFAESQNLTEEGDAVIQEFYTDKRFDTISVRVEMNRDRAKADETYAAELKDEQGTVICSQKLSVENDGKNHIILKMSPVKPAGRKKYTLIITREKTGESTVSFRFMKGRVLDSYEGKCMVNSKIRANDLSMDVYLEKQMKYCSKFTALVIIGGFFFVAMLLYAGLWEIKKKENNKCS